MGILGKFFGGGKDYPPLDESSPTAAYVQEVRNQLDSLAHEVPDPLEVIPARDSAYVFIGKPPKKFGVAWIQDGKVNNFKTLADEKGISPMKLQILSEKIREAYIRNESEPRFSAKIADRDVVVTPSESLHGELREIIHQAAG